MNKKERIELVNSTIKKLCKEVGATYKPLEEASGDYDYYETEFFVQGDLYDLHVQPILDADFQTGDLNDFELYVTTHNVLQIRQRKDLELHATVDTGPSGGRAGGIRPDHDVPLDKACEQVYDRFMKEHIPLQTLDELLTEIRKAKSTASNS